MNTDLDQLEQLRAKATPGPWEAEDCEGDLSVRAGTALTQWTEHADADGMPYRIGTPASSYKSTDLILEHNLETWDEGEDPCDDQRRADADWIAAIHNAAPALFAELREARNELAENEAVMNAIRRQRNKAELAIERARELHVEQLSRSVDFDGNAETYCDACYIGPFPCPTIRALDGDS
ncbi:hypothetical protein GS534_00830 [Rhodococcus hoagii]|nr:hypothetical protein [Prescottella equi]